MQIRELQNVKDDPNHHDMSSDNDGAIAASWGFPTCLWGASGCTGTRTTKPTTGTTSTFGTIGSTSHTANTTFSRCGFRDEYDFFVLDWEG